MPLPKLMMPAAILLILMAGFTNDLSAQGCSDAGLCTLNHAPPDTVSRKAHFEVSFSPVYGLGEKFNSIITPTLDAGLIYRGFHVGVRVPYQFVAGHAMSSNGLGDISLSLGYQHVFENSDLDATAGIRFPSGRTDLTYHGNPLPMVFQTGLGTVDLMVGLSFRIKERWMVAAAVQIPVYQRNKNLYLSEMYSPDDPLHGYFNARSLKRAADVMLRFGRTFYKNESAWTVGLLGLYHLREDTYLDLLDQRINYPGTDGFTLNLNGSYRYKITDHFSLDIVLGVPLYARHYRPDGLTRNLALIPSFKWRW